MSLRRLANHIFNHHLRHHHRHDPFHHQWYSHIFDDKEPFVKAAPRVYTILDPELQSRRERKQRYYGSVAAKQQAMEQQQQQQQQQQNTTTTSTNTNNNTAQNNNTDVQPSRGGGLSRRSHHHHRGDVSDWNHWGGWGGPSWWHPHRHSLAFTNPWSMFNEAAAATTMPEMTIDMFSSPQAYTIHAAVPGIDKNDISITVEDGVLNIEAERKEERKERRPNTNNNAATTNGNSANKDSEIKVNNQDATQSPSSQTIGTAATVSTAAPADPATTSSSSATTSTATPTTTSTASDSKSDAATTNTTTNAASTSNSVDDDYDYIESTYGHVSRAITLPEDVDVSALSAKYEDGLIKITLPRIQQQKVDKRQKITIQ